jgi:hypothetical protein
LSSAASLGRGLFGCLLRRFFGLFRRACFLLGRALLRQQLLARFPRLALLRLQCFVYRRLGLELLQRLLLGLAAEATRSWNDGSLNEGKKRSSWGAVILQACHLCRAGPTDKAAAPRRTLHRPATPLSVGHHRGAG